MSGYMTFLSVVQQPKSGLSCLNVEVAIPHRVRQTPGQSPLNEWSAHHRGFYLHITQHTRWTPMSSAGFKLMIPETEWPHTNALESMATRTGWHNDLIISIISLGLTLFQLCQWWWLYSVLEIMNGEEVGS